MTNKNIVILIVVFFFFVNNSVEASHVAGGNIKYSYLGPGSVSGTHKYKVTLAIFRDCNGLRYGTVTEKITAVCRPGGTPKIIKTAQKVYYTSKPGERQANLGAKDVSDICRSKPSRCSGQGNPGGFEVNYYEAIFELPSCNYWEFYMGPFLTGRNATINVTGGTVGGIARVFSSDFPRNNSPIFSDDLKPFPSVCIGQEVSYGNGALDPDGDSLRFELTPVVTSIDSTGKYTYANYNSGFSGINPIPSIQLDSNTGRIWFKTNVTGKYLVAYWVIEYERCTGKEIGRIMREIQFDVKSCSNNQPKDISGVSNVIGATKSGKYQIEVCRGAKFSWSDTIEDSDKIDSLWFGSNIDLVLPGATMNTTFLARNKAVVTFEWTATVGNNPNKTFFLKYDDNRCDFPGSGYSVFEIKVKNGIAAGQNQVICIGDTSQLKADGGYNYTWRSISGSPIVPGVNWFPDTTVSDTGKTIQFIPTTTTLLEVRSNLSTACNSLTNCSTVDTILVRTVDSFNITTVPDFTLCFPGNGQLNVFPSNNNQRYSYNWNNSTLLNNSTIKSPAFSGLKYTEIFNVTVTNDSGCVRNGVVNVIVTDPFPQNMKALVSDSVVCISKQVNLWVDQGMVDYGSCNASKTKCQGNYKKVDIGLGVLKNLPGGQDYPTIYPGDFKGKKVQFMYRASDLIAKGIEPGPIKSISFLIDSVFKDSNTIHEDFAIKMGCSSLQELPKSSYVNGLTQVFNPKKVVTRKGWNEHLFDNEYTWDGKSNLILEICWNLGTNKYTGAHIQGFDRQNYRSANHSVEANAVGYVCGYSAPSFGHTDVLPITRFNVCSGLRSSRFKYSWRPLGNGGFVGATNRDSAVARVNLSTAKNYVVFVEDSAYGICTDTLSVSVNVVSSYNSKPNFNPTQCYSQGRIQLTAPTPWNITNPGGRWSGVGVVNDSLGYWDPSISGKGSFMVKYKIQGDVCASVDSATIKIVGDPDPTVLGPDSFCSIYGGPGSFDTIRHRLVPKNPGGWFSGFGVDSAVKSMGSRMNYFLDGTKFNPTPNKPDTAYVRYRLTDGCTSDSLFKIPVIAPWDHSFQGVSSAGTPYPTVSFCTTNPSFDTLAVAGANPIWEYLDNPTAMVDRNLGVLDVKLASFGKDTVGRIKVGYYGFCGTDTIIQVAFVRAPEVEVCPKIFCEPFMNDPKNFARIDTIFLRIPKGPGLGGSGKKTLNRNGFDSQSEVKVAYGSIAHTGWTQAIDLASDQYNHNYWKGKPWMTLPNVARFRTFALPSGKHQLIYNFAFRYRQTHPDYACYSSDTVFIERVDSMHLTLKDTHRICGTSTVELNAGKYPEAIYKWNTGAVNSKLTVYSGGIYTVTVTTEYCITTKSTNVINGCVSVEENLENGVQIKLFPNPTSSIISLELNNSNSEHTQLRIIDLLGNEVSNTVFEDSKLDNTMQIDVSALAKGVYLFEIKNGESYSTYRVVVE